MMMSQITRILTGSHDEREPAFLVVGKLRRAHGVGGEIPLELYTHMLELFTPEDEVYIGESHVPYTIEKTRWKGDLLLIKLKGISDRTNASQLTNQLVYVQKSQLPDLEEGEFYYHDIIGLRVYDRNENYMGILRQILTTRANDVYVIQNDVGDEVLIPAIEDMILDVDLVQQRMVVGEMEWYGEGDE